MNLLDQLNGVLRVLKQLVSLSLFLRGQMCEYGCVLRVQYQKHIRYYIFVIGVVTHYLENFTYVACTMGFESFENSLRLLLGKYTMEYSV